jgi:hypothetical protein
MENIIGKKFHLKKELNDNNQLREFSIVDSEIIEDKLIVYTSDCESYLFDDLQISPFQVIEDLKKDEDFVSLIQSYINQNCDMKSLIDRKENIRKKTKTFKIFGWTITLSKSK